MIFLLILDRFQLHKAIITDDFTPALLKDHKRFVAASSKIQNSVVPLLFSMNQT